MGHKKADKRETVIKWLEYCHKKQRKPWLWDFKNCYTDSLPKDSITAFLKYKNGKSKDTTIFCITGKKGSSADCDKEANGLYQVLGWQNLAKDIIRGETMNSFLTTFNRAIDGTEINTRGELALGYVEVRLALFVFSPRMTY